MRKALVLLVLLGACGEGRSMEVVPREVAVPSPVPLPAPVLPLPEEDCDAVMTAADGSGGFLWKEADRGGWVVLFPGRFKVPFYEVLVLPAKARVGSDKRGPFDLSMALDSLRFAGLANPDKDGNRQHWRSKKSAKSFPDKSFVVATTQGGDLCVWQIGKAAKRND